MEGKSIYKIPDGKLLKIFLQFENNKINSIKITGDFFLHPEEGIEKIEQELIGVEIENGKIIEKIDETVKENKIELFGINSEGICRAILMAKGDSE